MSKNNSIMIYDVVALSDSVHKWVDNNFGADGYESIYKPMWSEVLKNSHFYNSSKN